MRPSERAWCALVAGVAAWDACCPAGETLSEGMGRWNRCRPVLARLPVAYVALHLLGALPPRLDLLHGLTVLRHR
ncbi:hypothetical protein ACAG26_24455 [Mycobacterium sp. pUA109]|uniref:DUF7427 family protein n=1 Tax=Mycobacterium sp. pUA109 TaxID=3238982 RepID=UPI00351B679F